MVVFQKFSDKKNIYTCAVVQIANSFGRNLQNPDTSKLEACRKVGFAMRTASINFKERSWAQSRKNQSKKRAARWTRGTKLKV